MKRKQKVSILGSGWVGTALALTLEPSHLLMASVQSQASFDGLEIQNKIILNRENSFRSSLFYETDVLVIAIPPKARYLEDLKVICRHIKKNTQLILLSSTSVYSQSKGLINEEDTQGLTNPSLMLEGECLVQSLYPSVLILRLGGLMGYNRTAGKYTAGKTLEHDAPVNYVHRDDVVRIIITCIETDIHATVFNVVAPLGCTKKEIYNYNTNRYGFEKTLFKSNEIKGKKVSSQRLINELNYTFLHASLETICSR